MASQNEPTQGQAFQGTPDNQDDVPTDQPALRMRAANLTEWRRT